MGNKSPEGYLFCDGKEYNIEEYKELANQIKEEFGRYNYYGGNGTETFAVPNLQGEFLRGYTSNSASSKTNGIQTANVGIHQDATKELNFIIGSVSEIWIDSFTVKQAKNVDSTLEFDTTTPRRNFYNRSAANDDNKYSDRETYYTARPTNTSVLYCIKY